MKAVTPELCSGVGEIYIHRGVIATPTFEVDYNITECVERGLKAKSNPSTRQQ